MSWPTENSLFLLLLGLLPLVYVVAVVIRRGVDEVTSLGCMGVLFIWIGYHLSPWLSYYSGDWFTWATFMIAFDYIDAGLIFSTLCMFGFIIGYEAVMSRHRRLFREVASRVFQVPKVPTVGLLVFTAVVFVLVPVETGGLQELWSSGSIRCETQFEERTAWERFLFVLATVNIVLDTLLACLASMYILQPSRLEPATRYGCGLLGLLVASLTSFWNFSRAAGYPFLLLGFLAIKLQGRRGAVPAVLCLAFVMWAGSVGIRYRAAYTCGLNNFLDAAFQGRANEDVPDSVTQDSLLSPAINPLCAVEAWTRKAWLIEVENPSAAYEGFTVFWNLHPFPSFLVPHMNTGPDLTEVMNTTGSCALPSPVLGELFYAFQYWGALLAIPTGMIYGWFESQSRRKLSLVSLICIILCFASFPTALHSGIRRASRLIVYGLILLAIQYYFERGRASASVGTPRPKCK